MASSCSPLVQISCLPPWRRNVHPSFRRSFSNSRLFILATVYIYVDIVNNRDVFDYIASGDVLLDTLGTVIHAYEEQHYPMLECRGGDLLRFLMDEHRLTQADLSDVGSQGVISELIHGKRELNVRQIRVLATRFNVSPSVFI